jgi:hypothetical protein
MLRKQLALIAIVCTFWACNLQAEQIHSTWVGGEKGVWEAPDNWSPWGEPNEADSVCVSSATVYVSENHEIGSLTIEGKVELEKGEWWHPTLTILNGLTNHGDLAIRIDIRSNVTNIAGAKLELGEHINIFGNLYNEVGGIITVDLTDIDVEEGGEVYNDGLIRSYTVGGIGETPYFHNNGEIQLFIGGGCNGAIFDNNSTAVIRGSGGVTGQQLHNKGIICASMGPLLLYFEGSLMNTGTLKNDVGATLHIPKASDVSNQGTIEANANGSIVLDCNLINEPNATIKLLGGTLAATSITQLADATLQGFGGITGNVVIDPDGIIKLTGPTNIVGDVEIKNDATLQISDGLTLITGQTTCNGTIHIKGGYVIPQGGLSGNCNVIWEPGIYTNVADFNLDGQVSLKDFAYFADTWLWQTAWR